MLFTKKLNSLSKFELTCHVIVHCTGQHERVYFCRPWLSSSRRCSCTCRRCKAPGSFTTTCSSTSWGRRCPTSTRRRKDGQLNMNQSRLMLKFLPSCHKHQAEFIWLLNSVRATKISYLIGSIALMFHLLKCLRSIAIFLKPLNSIEGFLMDKLLF